MTTPFCPINMALRGFVEPLAAGICRIRWLQLERSVDPVSRHVCYLCLFTPTTVVSPPTAMITMHMHFLAGQALFLTSLITGSLAHGNGMDMNMDQGMPMNVGNMIMYLHFVIGDNLWFLGWAPSTAGAMAGACIGLFMLAMAERWLTAMRGIMEEHWGTRFVPFSTLVLTFFNPPIFCSCTLGYVVLRSRFLKSSIAPPPWRRRRLWTMCSLGLAGCGITLLHSSSTMTSPVVFRKLLLPASTFFLCSALCGFSLRV